MATQTTLNFVYGQKVKEVEIASLLHSEVNSISWSPDGLHLATVSWNQINIWDTSDWTMVTSIADTNTSSYVWSPDSRYIAGTRGGESEQILIWEVETGNLILQLGRQRPDNANSIAFQPRSIAWHPDGQMIATEATLGLDDEVLLWDVDFDSNLRIPQRLDVAGEIRHIAFGLMWSESGNMLLVSGSRELDPNDGEQLYFTQTISYVIDIAENDTLLAIPERALGWGENDTKIISVISTGSSHSLNIWELSTGNVLITFDEHTSSILAIAWNSYAPVIASVDIDGHIYFWNPNTGINYENTETDTSVQDLAWKSNSNMLAVAVEGRVIIRIYDFGA